MRDAVPFDVTHLTPGFGARVDGVRLATLDADAFDALYRLWLSCGLLVFPRQFLADGEQIAFGRRFGPLEFPLITISNVHDDGGLRTPDDAWMRVLRGNQQWHIDSTYVAVQAKGAVLSAVVVAPEGGETEWADMAGAWDALPAPLRARLANLSAHHSIKRSQARFGDDYRAGEAHGGYGADAPPPLRPLVKVHPETGREALILGRHAYGIPGLTDAESDALLGELHDLAFRPPRLWIHRWRPGDVVVWDNRRLAHRGHPWDLSRPRVLRHTRIAGDPQTEYAPAV